MFARDTVLLSIDLQQWLDQPARGGRNNPSAEHNIARLFAGWRASGLPVVHVRHDARAGREFKAEAAPLEGELIIGKQAHSAFIATGLEQVLRSRGCKTLLLVGAGDSLESTARMSADLGFRTYLPADATFTFEKLDWSGRARSAAEVHDMLLANLSDEYCTIVTTAWLLTQMAGLQHTDAAA